MVWSQAGDVVRPPPECRLHKFDLARARVLLASDQRDASRAQLDKILREAHARGFVGIEFEARLALAELEKPRDVVRWLEPSWRCCKTALAARGLGWSLVKQQRADSM
jgi:hypothetical protein